MSPPNTTPPRRPRTQVLLPPGTPAGIVHLLGGALVGGYPHVCYDRLARALADAGGFVVVATPYEAALDHGAAARECSRTFADACGACGGAFGVDAANLPRHVVGHSLGAKLALLAAADRSSSDESGGPGGRVYLCAFTSATAQAQIGLLEQLCEALLRGTPAGAAVPVLAGVARRAAAAAGVEFAPNEEATLRRAGVLGEDPRADVRVCTLGADNLDMSMGLLAALKGTSSEGDASEGTGDPQLGASVSSTILPGLGHLSPVCVRVTPADLGAAAAQAADAAGLGGDGAGSGFAFGDEAAVDAVAFDAINYLKGFAS